MSDIIDYSSTEKEYIAGLLTRNIQQYESNYLKIVGQYGFAFCEKLRYVNTPSLTSIQSYGFSNCDSLDLSLCNFNSVSSINSGAFSYCRFPILNISLTFPKITSYINWDTGTWTNLCWLEKIILPNRSGQSMFCTGYNTGAFSGSTGEVYTESSDITHNVYSSLRDALDGSMITVVELPNVTNFAYNGFFHNGRYLKQIMIGNNDDETQSVAPLAVSPDTVFGNTGIGTDGCYGYIYVPDSLVEDYKTDTNWSLISDRIKGLSEVIPNHFGFKIDDSWEQIVENSINGTYSTKYELGSYKKVRTEYGVIDFYLIAKDTDVLSDDSGTASMTFLGLCPISIYINSDEYPTFQYPGGVGGYQQSTMKTYILPNMLDSFPSTLQNNIKSVKKYTYIRDYVDYPNSQDTITNRDYLSNETLFIPSQKELAYSMSGSSYSTLGVSYDFLYSKMNRSLIVNSQGGMISTRDSVPSGGTAQGLGGYLSFGNYLTLVGTGWVAGTKGTSYGVSKFLVGFCI